MAGLYFPDARVHLSVTDTNVHKLDAKLGIDPMELLRLIMGKVGRVPRRLKPVAARAR